MPDITMCDGHKCPKKFQCYERWLDEVVRENRIIDFVFDSDEIAIRMWQRRGIFVFDCNQKKEEF